MVTAADLFAKATTLQNEGNFEEASKIYLSLMGKGQLVPFCNYRLAAISNCVGEPLSAYELYNKAFSQQPDIARYLYGEGHPNSQYIFGGLKKEKELTACHLCGKEGTPKWCYPLPEAAGYNSFFNPVRLWMYCENCHHMFAGYFPENLFLYNDKPRSPNPAFFSYYSNVLSRIAQYTKGMSLFEVGIGACECLLTAREMGFETFGIDVIDKHVQMAVSNYNLNAQTHDFIAFDTDRKFDIIIMGDVLEHVIDPVAAIQKAYKLLSDDGVLWVSTPNFESAYSYYAGHQDPMRRQQFHLSYFSRDSFYKLLAMCGFSPADYSVSTHYNGSMEVIAVKNGSHGNI